MKKIISLIMVCSVMLCMFYGCSKKEGSKPENQESRTLSYVVDAYNASANQSAVRAYEALCDAVVNGEEEVLFNLSLLDSVNKLFYSDFPLSYLVSRLEINEKHSGVKIYYEKTPEEHKNAVEEFTAKVYEILDSCGYKKVDNNLFILNLYSYLAQNTELVSQCSYAYDVIANAKGYSFSISNAFCYLLNYAGIKASVANSDTSSGTSYMTETEFCGSQYMFLPFEETKINGGKGLCCFALDYSELAAMEFKNVYYSDGASVVFDDNDVVYSQFRDSAEYTLEGNNLSIIKNNGGIVQIAL